MRVALLCAALEFGSRRCAVDLAEGEAAKAPVARTADEPPAPVAEPAEGEYSTGDHATDAGQGLWTKRSNSTRLKGSRKDPMERQEFHHMHATMPAPAPMPQAAELELSGSGGPTIAGMSNALEDHWKSQGYDPRFLAAPMSEQEKASIAKANHDENFKGAQDRIAETKLEGKLGLNADSFKAKVEEYSQIPTKSAQKSAGAIGKSLLTSWNAWRADRDVFEEGWWVQNLLQDDHSETMTPHSEHQLEKLNGDAAQRWTLDEPVLKEAVEHEFWHTAWINARQVSRDSPKWYDLPQRFTTDQKLELAANMSAGSPIISGAASDGHVKACEHLTKPYIPAMLKHVYLKDIFVRLVSKFDIYASRGRGSDQDHVQFAKEFAETWTSASQKINEVFAAYDQASEIKEKNDRYFQQKGQGETCKFFHDLRIKLYGAPGQRGGMYMGFIEDYDTMLTMLLETVMKNSQMMPILESQLSTMQTQWREKYKEDIADATQKFKTKKGEADGLVNSIATNKRDKNQKESTLTESTNDDLPRMTQTLNTHQSTLAANKEKAAATQRETDALKGQVQTKKSELQTKQSELTAKDRALKEHQRDVATAERAVTKSQEDKELVENNIARLQDQVSSLDASVKKDEATLEKVEQEKAQHEQNAAQLTQTLNDLLAKHEAENAAFGTSKKQVPDIASAVTKWQARHNTLKNKVKHNILSTR